MIVWRWRPWGSEKIIRDGSCLVVRVIDDQGRRHYDVWQYPTSERAEAVLERLSAHNRRGERMRRPYPEAVILHVPHCREGQNLMAVTIEEAQTEYFNHRLHFCFQEMGFNLTAPLAAILATGTVPMVTVEAGNYGSHSYKPGPEEPADALDRLCLICRGTHTQQAEAILGRLQRP